MTPEELLAELLRERFGPVEELELERAGLPAWVRQEDARLVAAIRRSNERSAA